MTQDVGSAEVSPSAVAILVQDQVSPRKVRLDPLKHAVVEALAAINVQIIATPGVHLSAYLEHVGPDLRPVFFAESPAALVAAQNAVGAGRNATFCLLAVPTSFAHPSPVDLEWAEGLAAVAGDRTIYLTDSALSRTVLESHLGATRVDVRVLSPASNLLSTEPGSPFEQMKRWSPGDRAPEFCGVNWDFTPRKCAVLPTVAATESDVEELRATNRTEIMKIVADRKLVGEPLHIGILGHKLSFIDELARDIARASGSTVELDEWPNLGAPSDVQRARGVLARSDVLIGEWGRPNNVWIQRHARSDKRLIVRVHRYEVTTEFPRAIDMNRFDAGVVIVPWVGRALVQKFDWPAEKLVYIPNYIHTEYFRREKLPGAEFTLGIVGITPDLKRLDLALDLLAALRKEDLRYTLRVRGQLPTGHIHWSTNSAISEQWENVLFRLRTERLLRGAVHFDAPGRDMAAWFEGIGVILSLSDLEGSHVALAEGMASGALPIARPWPGVRTLWPADCVFHGMDDAVDQILRAQDESWRSETIDRFAAHPSLDQQRVIQAWWDLIKGDLESAQSAFGTVDWLADWYEPVDL